ncbi:MAG: hypothetical protein ACFB13_02900 [Kiloniellaceae bacterium]
MIRSLRALGTALLGGAVLGACAMSTEQTQQQFANDIRTRGGNPYIEAPVVRDFEQRIEAITLAEHIRDGSYAKRFDPRNEVVLGNFADRFDRKELDRYMALADQGFEAAAGALYPQIGNENGCTIDAAAAAFPRGGGAPLTFDWRLERGGCSDGLAQGVGRAVSGDGSATFVGRFDRGLMLDGVFQTKDAETGRHILVIGGVPQQELIGRHLAAFTNADGSRWFYYGAARSDAALHGFGMKVSDPPEARLVTMIGEFRDDKLGGFGAVQFKKTWDEIFSYGARLGSWKDGKAHGLTAYTDGAAVIEVGEYQNGKANGVVYGRYGSWEGAYHQFSVGTFRNGRQHGTRYVSESTTIDDQWTNEEYWVNGEMTGSTRWVDNVDLTQIFAIAAGSTFIATADIPSVSQMEIGGALVSDVFNGNGPNALNNLQARYAAAAQSSQSGSSSGGASQSSSGGGPLKTYNAVFTCPETGRQANIPVPYRTEMCRVAAIDFAKTYACNLMDQERVMRNCQAACGDPQCLQQ